MWGDRLWNSAFCRREGRYALLFWKPEMWVEQRFMLCVRDVRTTSLTSTIMFSGLRVDYVDQNIIVCMKDNSLICKFWNQIGISGQTWLVNDEMNVFIHLFGTEIISWPFYILSDLLWKRNMLMIQMLTDTIVSCILDIFQ